MIGETHFGYFECENLKKYDEVAKKWKLIDEILKKFKKKICPFDARM